MYGRVSAADYLRESGLINKFMFRATRVGDACMAPNRYLVNWVNLYDAPNFDTARQGTRERVWRPRTSHLATTDLLKAGDCGPAPLNWGLWRVLITCRLLVIQTKYLECLFTRVFGIELMLNHKGQCAKRLKKISLVDMLILDWILFYSPSISV